MPRLKSPPPLVGKLPPIVGPMSRQEAERIRDAERRARENSLRPLYATKRWRELRLVILERSGWMCQGCDAPHLLIGRHPAPDSPVIDHIEPHRGDLSRFWDEGNLQAVCKAYHDSTKQRLEREAKGAGGGSDR